MASSTEIRVSTTFFPSALLPNVPDGGRSDLIVHTSDTVFFYVHQSVLRARSSNDFGMLLSTQYYTPNTSPSTHREIHDQNQGTRDYFHDESGDSMPVTKSSPPDQGNTIPTIFVSEESVVFNLILHLTYGMPCSRYGPGIEVISGALEALPRYGLPTPGPTNEIWTVLLRQAEADPLRVYSLGAAYAVDSVCTQSSEHTLNTPLSSLSEADAMTMGAIYLRRLFFLHFGRVEALKRILGPPPDTHPDSTACFEVTQRAVKKAWKAALAELLLAEMPQATPVSSIVSAFGPIANSTHCLVCKEKVQERIASVVQKWGNVKRII
ncbi:hypothetical protein FS837_001492 [Tulasnella sp. UAMH 9824]|nr:hypothetical protein FS837_001492 [Tulasnella sp. UAMH 9824]